MSSLKEQFGRELRKIRRQTGLTQEQLAEHANLSVSYIARIERGEKWVSPEVLDALAAALDIHVSALFTADETDEECDRDTLEREIGAIRKLLKGHSAGDLRLAREILERFFARRRRP